MEQFAWLILLMAVAIVAAYFYLKRRAATLDTSTPSEDRPESAP